MDTTTKTLKFSLIIAVLFLSGVHSVHAKDVVLHFNQWFPKDHWSQTQGLYPWFEEIEKVTEGRVTVAISDQPLASPRKSYQAVVDGAVDIAWGPHGYKPDRFPLSKIVEQPFTSHDAGVSSAAYWEIWERFFQPSGMQSDVVTLGMHTSSGNNIHMRNRSVTNAHEMLYSRLGVHTKTIGHIMGDYGFGYVLSPITQLEEMLLSNEIQGTVISDDWSIGFNLSELLNTVTHVPGGVSSSSFYIVINKDKWAMISPSSHSIHFRKTHQSENGRPMASRKSKSTEYSGGRTR